MKFKDFFYANFVAQGGAISTQDCKIQPIKEKGAEDSELRLFSVVRDGKNYLVDLYTGSVLRKDGKYNNLITPYTNGSSLQVREALDLICDVCIAALDPTGSEDFGTDHIARYELGPFVMEVTYALKDEVSQSWDITEIDMSFCQRSFVFKNRIWEKK